MAEWFVEAETLEDLADGLWISVKRLVRCKNCRWWERDYQPRYHPDERPCNIVGMGTPPDWFCADGERREGEEG